MMTPRRGQWVVASDPTSSTARQRSRARRVLADVPTVAERVVELAVQVAPKHFGERLADLGSGCNRLREHGLGVGVDLEREHD